MGDIAAERGQEPFDTLVEIALADRLRTGLRPPIPESEADWKLRARVWQDPARWWAGPTPVRTST